MQKLEFRRVLQQARGFELDALNRVEIAGLGSFYPADVLAAAHLQSEVPRPNVPTSEGALTVFFRLIDQDGKENIEIVEQVYPGVFHYGGWIWPSADGRANLAITKDVVNGRFVLVSTIDGTAVEFKYISGQYLADSQFASVKKAA